MSYKKLKAQGLGRPEDPIRSLNVHLDRLGRFGQRVSVRTKHYGPQTDTCWT